MSAPRSIRARIDQGLRLVTVPFPHLAGLVAAARVTLDERVPTMGVFASGRLVVNPGFAARLNDRDLTFVLAHEMMHLALRTHDRMKGSSRLEFNYAHDYIINDLLRTELGVQTIPADGLDMPGARERSAEELVLEMRRKGSETPSRSRVWEGRPMTAGQRFPGRGAGGRSGADAPAGQAAESGTGGEPGDGGDALADELERDWFAADADAQAAEADRIKALAVKALAAAEAIAALRGGRGTTPGATTRTVEALRGIYRTPWRLLLQRWLESVAPGERSFNRPSRRAQPRADVVLPGRRRTGWLLNVVLDTSGSMTEEIPRALGAIADFCDTVGVDQVRLVQCDAGVTADETFSPDELARRVISGYGGSDLSPALYHLAEDAATVAVILVTDGDVAIPAGPMPFEVLWLLPPGARSDFTPPYGRVVMMQ